MDKEARNEYNRRYYAEHRDVIREQTRQRRVLNRDAINERQRRHNAEHRDEIRKYGRRYHAEHQDHLNALGRQSVYRRLGRKPMSENRSCPLFLGVYVAEQLLSHLFENVTRMPINNPGYDFICGQGYLVDVKSACGYMSRWGTITWSYNIKRNLIADYFLCIAFGNRHDLNPLHYWLIPGDVLSHLKSARISETTLDKWAEYEKPIDKAISCCNTMKGEIR